MHSYRLLATVIALMLGALPAAALKNVPYPEVKVKVSEPYKPDADFQKMHAAFANAAAKKDEAALFALIGPTFVWTSGGELTEQFDLGRDALHNFKVVFGFRAEGADKDGPVKDGPYWDSLAAFAADGTYYRATDSGNLVCGPIAAEIADDGVFERARKRIESEDEQADWYFTLREVAVAKAPGDTGAPIAKFGTVAVPALAAHPTAPQGQPALAPTHLQVLLPSGKTGWIAAEAARPLDSDRLCYAKTADGAWKIAAFDQSE
jgi:hypothetical protein